VDAGEVEQESTEKSEAIPEEANGDDKSDENAGFDKAEEATAAPCDAARLESDAAETNEAGGLVEGDDFTVELQPESSELDLSSQDAVAVDKPVNEDLASEAKQNIGPSASGTSVETISADEGCVTATDSDGTLGQADGTTVILLKL